MYPKTFPHQPEYLAYVERLRVVRPVGATVRGAVGCYVNPNSKLIRVERVLERDGSRAGMIVNLTDIWRPVDLVPNFGEACPPEWTTDSSVEMANEFFINSFHDKQTYICLR